MLWNKGLNDLGHRPLVTPLIDRLDADNLLQKLDSFVAYVNSSVLGATALMAGERGVNANEKLWTITAIRKSPR